MERKGDTQQRVAEEFGVKQPSVSEWISFGRIGKKHLTHLVEYFSPVVGPEHWGLPAEWRSRPVGAQADGATAASYAQPHPVSHPDDDDVVIDEFDTGGKMGDGLVLRDQPGVIKGWRVSRDWVSQNVRNCTATANLCIVTGFGDSMRPIYNPGDPLLVDRGVRSVEYDAMYFFRCESEGFIKRLQRIPGQGLIAISENKAYRDWTITKDMDFEVFGRVLKVWRGEEF